MVSLGGVVQLRAVWEIFGLTYLSHDWEYRASLHTPHMERHHVHGKIFSRIPFKFRNILKLLHIVHDWIIS